MADINIPGISDKYKTNDLVESLMKVERVPLTREQKSLDTYKEQQSAWRDVNKKLSSLRDSVKTLYSFDNPFNNKLTSSTDETAVTADADRNAVYENFTIKVDSPATADRFLSGELGKDSTVPEGTYTYRVAGKTVSMKWNGGSLTDFTGALNRRANGVIKASTIGVNKGNVSLVIESLKTGKASRLQFLDDAKKYAAETSMIRPVKKDIRTFATSKNELKAPPQTIEKDRQEGMPEISSDNVTVSGGVITVPPRGGATIPVPSSAAGKNSSIEFSLAHAATEDITAALNEQSAEPVLPDAGGVAYGGVSVKNKPSDPALPAQPVKPAAPLKPVASDNVIFLGMKDGTEQPLATGAFKTDETGKTTVLISSGNYPDIASIIIRNINTGTQYSLSDFKSYKTDADLGYEPVHAISKAQDAQFEYDGIPISRPENDIDDVVPHITLHLHGKTTAAPATVSVKPDTDAAKQALITFVGKYNQAVAEINILSQNKPELITELDYLSDDEAKAETKKLGMFMADFSLTRLKSSLQNIAAANYTYSDQAKITMLSQIGISTNAAGSSSSYSAGRLRGYLEIDEKKLDSTLQDNLDAVKNIFGYDSDGDLIIDSGIGYAMDRNITPYVQSGGIIATRTSSLDSKIDDSENKIAELKTQLDDKESELKSKYGQMESTLNSLQSQQDSITNFTKQRNSN